MIFCSVASFFANWYCFYNPTLSDFISFGDLSHRRWISPHKFVNLCPFPSPRFHHFPHTKESRCRVSERKTVNKRFSKRSPTYASWRRALRPTINATGVVGGSCNNIRGLNFYNLKLWINIFFYFLLHFAFCI